MIDKIVIRFSNFSGSLDNCRPQRELIKKESDWDKYRLPRSSRKGDHSLFVGVNKEVKKRLLFREVLGTGFMVNPLSEI